MWRLYFLIEHCYKMREPVLLIGETGCGKTTVCQLLSIVLGSKLHILNYCQYTETSDFLGLGLSGQLLSGSDIGGFAGNATPKLFGRWMALGAMFPFCRGHSEASTIGQEPWSFGEENVEELMSLPPEKILLRWINFQLKKSGYKKTINSCTKLDCTGLDAYG